MKKIKKIKKIPAFDSAGLRGAVKEAWAELKHLREALGWKDESESC